MYVLSNFTQNFELALLSITALFTRVVYGYTVCVYFLLKTNCLQGLFQKENIDIRSCKVYNVLKTMWNWRSWSLIQEHDSTSTSTSTTTTTTVTNKAQNKFWAPTGFEPMTSAIPLRWSTDWAMKPRQKLAGQLRVQFIPLYAENHVMCIWIWVNCR